jgi:hypothetical protein
MIFRAVDSPCNLLCNADKMHLCMCSCTRQHVWVHTAFLHHDMKCEGLCYAPQDDKRYTIHGQAASDAKFRWC